MGTRRVVVGLIVTLAGAGVNAPALYAQNEGADHPIHGVRKADTWLADRVVRRRCPAFVLREPIPLESRRDTTPVASWCRVDTAYVLPNANYTRWLAVEYSHYRSYPADSEFRAINGVTRDTVRLLTTVLYEWRDHSLEWNPAWVGTADFEYIRSITLAASARPDRSILVGVRYCVNGTGGCWQRYIRRLKYQWAEVTEAFWWQLPPISGGRIGKGLGVDLATLAGSYGVYAPNDANCCPSRELRLQLAQRGDSLVLVSHEVRPTRP